MEPDRVTPVVEQWRDQTDRLVMALFLLAAVLAVVTGLCLR